MRITLNNAHLTYGATTENLKCHDKRVRSLRSLNYPWKGGSIVRTQQTSPENQLLHPGEKGGSFAPLDPPV